MNDMETVSWETSCLEISNGKITANIPERLAARRLFPFHLLPLEYNPENEGRYQVLVLNIPVLKRIDSSWIHGCVSDASAWISCQKEAFTTCSANEIENNM